MGMVTMSPRNKKQNTMPVNFPNYLETMKKPLDPERWQIALPRDVFPYEQTEKTE